MEEDELKKMMEEFGPVYQLGVIRDKASGQHRGKYLCLRTLCYCIFLHKAAEFALFGSRKILYNSM